MGQRPLQSRHLLVFCLALVAASCDKPAPVVAPPPAPTSAPPSQPVAALCPPAATEADDTLQALAAKAEKRGSVRVIVRLNAPMPLPGIAQAAASDAETKAMSQFATAGVNKVAPIGRGLPFIIAEVTAPQLKALVAKDPTLHLTEDRIAFPTLAQSGPLIGAPDLWAIGGRGAGQTVAILDTGVDKTHPFLAGRIVAEACFSTTSAASGSTSLCPNGAASVIAASAAQPCTADGCEHGTHVAGIAAGRGTDFSGIAPDASIIAVQVFSRFEGADCGGQPSPCIASFTSDQIRGLDYVLQQTASRKVASVNMSLGGGRSTTACDTDATKPAIDQLRATGVATVIAAGNDGYRDAVSFPGCISTAVTVGATTKQDKLASFSNCSAQVDLNAPGVDITSSIPGGKFASLSGTSMATPHVTGAFAALRSLHPTATVDQIEDALKSTGLDVGGRPRIRLPEAEKVLQKVAPAPANDTSVNSEIAVVKSDPTPPALQSALKDLAALPQDTPVRLIVGVKGDKNAGPAQVGDALTRAEAAAKKAGCQKVERLGGQPSLMIEATPKTARILAASGTIQTIQIDRAARTQ